MTFKSIWWIIDFMLYDFYKCEGLKKPFLIIYVNKYNYDTSGRVELG